MYESCTHIHIRRFPLHSFSLPPVYIPQLRAKEQNEYRDRDLKEHEDDVIRVLVTDWYKGGTYADGRPGVAFTSVILDEAHMIKVRRRKRRLHRVCVCVCVCACMLSIVVFCSVYDADSLFCLFLLLFSLSLSLSLSPPPPPQEPHLVLGSRSDAHVPPRNAGGGCDRNTLQQQH